MIQGSWPKDFDYHSAHSVLSLNRLEDQAQAKREQSIKCRERPRDRVDKVRASGFPTERMDRGRRPDRAVTAAVISLFFVCGATACGGSKQAQPTTTSPGRPVPTLGGPTHHNSPGDKRAALLKAGSLPPATSFTISPSTTEADSRTVARQRLRSRRRHNASRLQQLRQLQQRNNPSPVPPAQILRVDITNGSRTS